MAQASRCNWSDCGNCRTREAMQPCRACEPGIQQRSGNRETRQKSARPARSGDPFDRFIAAAQLRPPPQRTRRSDVGRAVASPAPLKGPVTSARSAQDGSGSGGAEFRRTGLGQRRAPPVPQLPSLANRDSGSSAPPFSGSAWDSAPEQAGNFAPGLKSSKRMLAEPVL